MRPRDNILRAAIVGVVHYFSAHDARDEMDLNEILFTAFDWEEDERAVKLDAYVNRIERLRDLYSLVIASRQEIAQSLKIDEAQVNLAIDKLKDHGFIVQFGRGHGKLFGMTGTVIMFDDIADFKLILLQEDKEPNVLPIDQALPIENMTPQELFLHFSENFKRVAQQFDGVALANKNELKEAAERIEALEEENARLHKEVRLIKQTSWQ